MRYQVAVLMRLVRCKNTVTRRIAHANVVFLQVLIRRCIPNDYGVGHWLNSGVPQASKAHYVFAVRSSSASDGGTFTVLTLSRPVVSFD